MAFSLFNFGKSDTNNKNKVVDIKLDQIIPNRYQPRKVFNQDEIRELAHTIDEHGLLQPIVLREYEPAKYEIIAGERRYRAMKMLGWETTPAILRKMTDEESASLALIENLQRAQLSSVEEAQAYRQLMDLNHLTQAALAKGMGKSLSFVANKLRLLKLITPVQTAILDHRISERHGRALLDLDEKQQRTMLMRIVNERLTVRQTEEFWDGHCHQKLLSKRSWPRSRQLSRPGWLMKRPRRSPLRRPKEKLPRRRPSRAPWLRTGAWP